MMRTLSVLLVGFCALHFTVAAPRDDHTAHEREKWQAAPAPINCQWSRWTEWTECNPCTKSHRRSRGIEVCGQFGGEPCSGSIGDEEACTTNAECPLIQFPECSESQFACDSGMCIKKALVCNSDMDCDDMSDETCDNPVRKPCGATFLDNNEQGRTAGYGINILGLDPRRLPFNNDFFNGKCNRVMNPNTQKMDRLPWNVGTLNYETLAEETASKEIYEDTHSLIRELMTETKFSIGIGGSVKFKPSEKDSSSSDSNKTFSGGIGADLDFSRNNMIKEVSEYTTIKKKSFMRVKGKVQLSKYRLLSHDLEVVDNFIKDVMRLPLKYEKGEYFNFVEDYGTHYTKNGVSGGEYELVYVLNQDSIKEQHLTERELQNCVKVGITADFQVSSGIEAEASIKPDYCKKVTLKNEDNKEGKALVDKVVTAVRGGTIAAASAMRAKLNKDGLMDLGVYTQWAQTLADNPALLKSEPEPIYTIIPLNLPNVNKYRDNIKRAIAEYVAEYSVCKCQPCQNGGTVVFIDGNCLCLCPTKYEGLACQILKPDKNKGGSIQLMPEPVTQVGNWGCWSAWSGCSGDRRSRTRICNTGQLSGATCLGSTNSEEYC